MATATELMQQLRERALENASEVAEINASYCFTLTGSDGGTWLVHLRQPVEVKPVSADQASADCRLTLSAADFIALLEGNANAQQLFFAGKLEVEGEMHHALKLQKLTDLLQ